MAKYSNQLHTLEIICQIARNTHPRKRKETDSWKGTEITPVLPIAGQNTRDISRDIWKFFGIYIYKYLFIYFKISR